MHKKQQDTQAFLDSLNQSGQQNLSSKLKPIFEGLEHEIERKEDHILKLHRELRQVKKSLEGMDEIRNEFISICAHDLRSPLSGIISFLEILRVDGKQLPQREIDDIHKRMERSSSHMLSLINDLLDLGNMNSGKFNITPEPIFLSHICKEGLEHSKARMESKEIQSKITIGNGELRVKLDPQKSLQILNNLISNAIKFTPRGGIIELNIQTSDRLMTLEVKDSGQGIPPEEVEKIFEKFQKTSTQATEGEKGSGLGLSIVYQLVELQQGKIEVKSKVGQGTSFFISFPVAESTKLLDLFSGKKK